MANIMPTSAFFDVNKVRSCNLQLFFMNNNVFSSIPNHPLFCLACVQQNTSPFNSKYNNLTKNRYIYVNTNVRIRKISLKYPIYINSH